MRKMKLRLTLEQHAQGCCEYCHYPQKVSGGVLHIEHIIARSKGGSDALDNLALSCPRCNGHKGEKTEGYDFLTGQRSPLFNPRKDNWSEHFRQNRQTGLIEGLTPIGRVTVQA